MMRKLYKSFRLGNKANRNAGEPRRSGSFREQLRIDQSQTATGAQTAGAIPSTDAPQTNSNGTVVKPPEWEKDEELVRGSHCQFRVKYLGAKEVNDSRGMQLCDDAFSALMTRYKQTKKSGNGLSSLVHSKILKSKNGSSISANGSQRPAANAIFYISSDGLRVVDENSKSLIVDQTIEKVSFCAPVRLNTRGFAYIARDGASKRWMCHVLLAKDVQGEGERLSHAVGCAFSACLEAKKQRDALCSVEANFHNKNKSVFEKQGTFRDTKASSSLQGKSSDEKLKADEKRKEPLSKRVYGVVKNPIPEDEEWTEETPSSPTAVGSTEPVAQPESAIERKHAPAAMLERMQSMREFSKLNSKHDLPFKHRNKSMQMKHSTSLNESLGSSTEFNRTRPGILKQQSLCIDDSMSPISKQPITHHSEHSSVINSFEDSFAESTQITVSTIPDTRSNNSNAAPVGSQQPGSGSKQTTVTASHTSPNISELSSTNPFFIFVSNQTPLTSSSSSSEPPGVGGSVSASVSVYSPTNPFNKQGPSFLV